MKTGHVDTSRHVSGPGPDARAPPPPRARWHYCLIRLPQTHATTIRAATDADADAMARIVAEGLADKVTPAFGDRGPAAIAALIRRDLPRTTVRYLVAEADGAVVGTARIALRQDASAGGLGPVARAIGWPRATRGALVLGLLAHPRLADDEAYVEELAVSPSHRRRGIGRALLTECHAIAERAAKRRVTLWVTGNNAPAVAMYREGGYRVTRRRRALRTWLLFGAPVSLLMEKRLG